MSWLDEWMLNQFFYITLRQKCGNVRALLLRLSMSLTRWDTNMDCFDFFPKPKRLCGFFIIVGHPWGTDLLTTTPAGLSQSFSLRTEWGCDLGIQSPRGHMQGSTSLQMCIHSDFSQSSLEIPDYPGTLFLSCSVPFHILPSPAWMTLAFRLYMLTDTTKYTERCNFLSLTHNLQCPRDANAGRTANQFPEPDLVSTLTKNSHIAEAHYRLKWKEQIKGAPQQVNFLN